MHVKNLPSLSFLPQRSMVQRVKICSGLCSENSSMHVLVSLRTPGLLPAMVRLAPYRIPAVLLTVSFMGLSFWSSHTVL